MCSAIQNQEIMAALGYMVYKIWCFFVENQFCFIIKALHVHVITCETWHICLAVFSLGNSYSFIEHEFDI